MAEVSHSMRIKNRLEETSSMFTQQQGLAEMALPPGAFAMLLHDDGTVAEEHNASQVNGINFLKDNDPTMQRLFQKLKARAISGGGYVHFRWVHPKKNVLTNYVAFAKRRGQNTLCVAEPSTRFNLSSIVKRLKPKPKSANV